MKLIFFSDLGCIAAAEFRTQLIKLTGKQKPIVAYVSSAWDGERKYYQQNQEYYSKSNILLGSYFDLETEFNIESAEKTFQADAIHLSGGNTYRFLYWIKQRGFQKRLIDYVNSGGAIIGVSAGSIIMTPNISTSRLCGDTNDIGLKNEGGLNLVDFHYLPHVDSRSLLTNAMIKSQQDRSAIVVAADSDYLVINGAKLEVYGKPRLIVNGKITNSLLKII